MFNILSTPPICVNMYITYVIRINKPPTREAIQVRITKSHTVSKVAKKSLYIMSRKEISTEILVKLSYIETVQPTTSLNMRVIN